MRSIVRLLTVALLVLGVVLVAFWYERPGLGEYHQHLIPRTSDMHPRALRATWLGVTALLLDDGAHAVMIDPFFTRPPGLMALALNRTIEPNETLIKDWLARLKVTKLDAVLVSHSHFDHAMDAGVVARLTGARLIGSESTLNIGRGAGMDEAHLVKASRSTLTFGEFRVTFVESAHAGATGGKPLGEITEPLVPPAHYLDYKLGGTYSILVAHPQGSILHHGSAGFVPGALEGQHADVAFLGVALIDRMEPYLRETVDAVGASRVVPVHWDDFTKPLQDGMVPIPFAVHLDEFFADMRRLRPSLQVQTMLPERTVLLFPAK
ncbi:MAG: fold metallo-hydrolase [Panacagrimonas sp.]|jgi:L-ascorbate metabolism protein UlaG (beta-lactamase superfamily)|nr:MBL fold metallo-hydrolase [Panacagrimonas sp.]MCC2657741.1 fold metallo-hydrolase [Panacagrimonas sp.]